MMKTLATNKVAAVVVGLGLVLAFGFAYATPAKAQSVSDLQAQINSLLATIAQLQSQIAGQTGGTTTGGTCTGFTFTRNHSQGDTGGEVMEIQKFLNKMADTQVAATGAGSPGNETSYFGPATKAAVMKYQNKYASAVLTPVGLTAGTGYWGASTRAHANSMNANCGTTGTGPGPVVPTGTGLVVASTAQPANALAPELASRVPFTMLTLTNASGAAVTVNGINVERTGSAADAVFSGIVVIDETGAQLGVQKTLNSNHQAKVGDPFVIQPGQTKTLTIAGNMATSLDNYQGQVVSVAVIGVDTTATVSGSLPITGASHTINSTLTIGTLPMTQGTADPDTSSSREIGVTNFLFQSVRATAGSAEDVWVKSIRWNQTGSIGGGDIANVRTVVDGVEYPATLSADGKYYTTVFAGNGLKIEKGLQKEFEIKADLVGGSGRTIAFDIYKATDIYAVGGTYGYGITPTQSENGTASDASSQFTSGTPFFDGSTVTVTGGSVTSVSRANEVPAQNVVENTPNQPLGGFVVDLKGEAISVQQMVFQIGVSGSTADVADVTNVTLVDENGVVVAGPVDGVAGSTDAVTFTDTVTFPTGRHIYTLKGKLGTDFANGDTVSASTTPSSGWSNITGQTTGDTISLSSLSTSVTGNTMTVKAGSVAVSINSTPAAQNVVAGVTGFTFGSYRFDAAQSGEDVRFSTLKFYYDEVSAMAVDPINCFVWDGATRLSTSAVNPDADGDDTYTLDTQLTVPKGAVKTVDVKCDLPATASSGSFAFDLNTSSGSATFSGTGQGSGQTITPTTPSTSLTDGNTQTVATAGALTVSKDSSSPSYAVAAGGTSDVVLGVLKFNATNEDMRLDRVALQMSNVAATSSPSDIQLVTLWDGATQVGTAVFTGSSRYATSTLTQTVTIPKDSDKKITVKGNLSAIGTSQPGTQGSLIQVDYDGDDSTGTRAIGQASGTTVNTSSTSDTSVDGVRLFRGFPTFAKLTVPTNTLANGSQSLLRFSVTANSSRDVGIYKFTLDLSTTTASVTGINIFGFTDSGFSTPVSGTTAGGQLDDSNKTVDNNGIAEVYAENSSGTATPLQVPAGSTYYFEVRGTVSGTASGASVQTQIEGDAAYPSAIAGLLASASSIDSETHDDFIWSPNATTTSGTDHLDWTNGYGLVGLPSTNMSAEVLSK